MKLEFSYLGKYSLKKLVIISLLFLIILLGIYFLIGDNAILNMVLSFNIILFVSSLIAYFVYKDYPKKYYSIISNGDKVKGEITGCYVRTIRGRGTHFKYGEIQVSVDDGIKTYCFKDIVYNKKFVELKKMSEDIWNKKKDNWTYRGRVEITLYELNGEVAADLDSIKFVEEYII